MLSRATNPIDFAKAIGCFSIVWYHSQYYWSLNSGNRHDIDLAKFYFISWAMPFFYISAFYFITRYGIQKESPSKVLRKMGRIFSVQILVIIIYGIYQLSVNLFLRDNSLQFLVSQFYRNLSFGNCLLVFNSGNSTPAYFLAQIFFLYLPLYLMGRVLAFTKYFALIAIGFLLVVYFSNFENSFITKESYIYLAISIALLTINFREVRDNSLYKILFCISISVVVFWRLNHGEFLLFGLAIWGIFSFLSRGSRSILLAAKVSSFGSSYSLFVFLFHLLFLQVIEKLVLYPKINSIISDSNQIATYISVNILAFGFTSISAIFLNRFSGLRLKI
jgi:hypothetical protein